MESGAGFFSKQADDYQRNEVVPSNNDHSKNTKHKHHRFTPHKKRGRKPRNYTQTSQPPSSIQKTRKIEKIEAYQKALQTLRSSCTQFYWPFDSFPLNTNKQQIIKCLKQVKDHESLRRAVRNVGIRHERNLLKHGVRENLSIILNYLETGKIPRWIKDHFDQLMERNFQDQGATVMVPILIDPS